MKIFPGRYVARILYAETLLWNFRGNIMGWVYRDKDVDRIKEPGEWCIYVRTRHYLDDDLTRSSKDVRRPHLFMKTGRFEEIYPEMVATLRLLATLGGNPHLEEIVVDSADPEVVMAKLGEKPWAHVSVKGPYA
jgi:hypothetical protein